MPKQEIEFIREIFNLTQRDLAKILNVAPYSVERWEKEDGTTTPVGLASEVLRGLHMTALHLEGDKEEAKRISGRIRLGIGSVIFYELLNLCDGRPECTDAPS